MANPSDDIDRSDDSEEEEVVQQAPKALYVAERFDPMVLSIMMRQQRKVVAWRMKERMKTVSVALTLCLNIGVDPPDVVKTTPCARFECWVDPQSMPPPKAIDTIGKALQMQYERWQPRAKYKHCLDPTIEDVKKLCQSLRRNAKDERVLMHYNGHGVPKPTNNGECWVFNKDYTQYIPLSIYELQSWVGNPSIYVFDCPAAGVIVHWFLKFADQRDQEAEAKRKAAGVSSASLSSSSSGANLNGSSGQDFILLAACSANEVLPTNPDLPADLFTACLTTPIKMALSWFARQTIVSGITADLIEKIPGRHVDRRTPLGELNWIFTAITDTIAWNVLPQDLFQKLFRQDLLVASLFRNYLLAERIMRTCMCTPVSFPKLPTTYNHPMWQAWDLAADQCLAQLPQLVNDPNYEYRHSSFFTDQLTAFEVWLEFGAEDREPPEQLPIVLQVLLSQQHRLRALELLSKFLDLGPWAVNQALSVGIFPYVLKLLQSPAAELRKVLVFIWAKILALDKSCQLDLVKDNGQHYFVGVLSNAKIPNDERHQAAFILSVICNNCRPGQSACLNARLLSICLLILTNQDPLLRRWVVFCLAKLWENHEEGKRAAIAESAHIALCGLLQDPVPEVRAAAIYALGTLIGFTPSSEQEDDQRTVIELNLGLTFAVVTADASPLVRKELVVALSALVNSYEEKFRQIEINALLGESRTFPFISKGPKVAQAAQSKEQTVKVQTNPDDENGEENGIYEFLWKLVGSLTNDPYPLVAKMARAVVARIRVHAEEFTRPSPQTPAKGTSTPQAPAKAQSISSERSGRTLTPGGPDKSQRSKSPASTQSVGAKIAGMLSGKKPSSRNLAPVGNMEKSISPVGSMDDDFPQLPDDIVRSKIYDWSCQFFSMPLLSGTEEDETDPVFHERKFRFRRNRDLVQDAVLLKEKPVKKPCLENEIAILEQDNRMVSQVHFHPFENVALVSDNHDGITLWDWEGGQKLNFFSNQNPQGSRITHLSFLNEADNSFAAVASDDGVVRIWGGIQSMQSLKLVTSWKALNFEGDLLPVVRGAGAGLVLAWQPQSELAVAAGNVDVVKVWDVSRELSIQDLPTQASAAVTCLTTDKHDGKFIVAGCADGSLRVFDRRAGSRFQLSNSFAEHKGWVVNVAMPPSLDHQLISTASSGDVKFWDLRSNKSSQQTLIAHQHPVVTAASVHPYAPIVAIGSQDQRIRVMTFQGDEVALIRYHDGFLGQRIGPVSALSFHPYRMMLAAGATDSIVSVHSNDPAVKK